MNLRLLAVALCLSIPLLAAPLLADEESAPSWKERMDAKVPSVVTLRFVVKIQMQGGEREGSGEVPANLVGARGLVMTANSHLDPASQLPPQMRDQVKASVVEMKVFFGNEEDEYEAVVVARDSNLDLAFLQILELEEREILPVDLRTGSAPEIGEELWGVSRTSRGFDSTPVMGLLYINGKMEKPRSMWSFGGQHPGVGLPVFHLDGSPAGVISRQQSSAGVGGRPQTRFVVLPLEDVRRSLEGAEKRAEEALAAEEGDGAEDSDEATEPETPEQPEDDTPDDE